MGKLTESPKVFKSLCWDSGLQGSVPSYCWFLTRQVARLYCPGQVFILWWMERDQGILQLMPAYLFVKLVLV